MFLYKTINILLTPFTILFILYRRLTGKEDPERFLERLAITKQKRYKHKKLIWFHAASIGESLSILTIVDHLCQNKTIQILFTSGTTSSASILKEKLPSNVTHQYVPIENIFIINKFLKHWQPSLAIFVESEFWPLLIKSTKKYCKIISLNTSISEKSFKKWNRFHRLKTEIFNDISIFIPKSSQDEERLRLLKINNTKYLGNLKYCAEPLKYNIALLKQLQTQLSNRHIILFASIHTQEERIVIEIYQQLKKITKEDFIFIVAPRHPNKLDSLCSALKKQHINYLLHSATKPITDKIQFYIIDSFGQLGTFFRLSPITVMGGTFEKIGGHNIIEPSKLGSIVVNGPYDYSIAEMSQEFTEKNALLKVSNAQDCSLLLNSFFLNPLEYQQYSINALELIKEKQNILINIIKIIENEF